MINKIAIIGVGLIGGSLALQCRKKAIAEKIIGARDFGVEIFFTPIENCQDISNIEALGQGKGEKAMKIVPEIGRAHV